jgi:hypothetical protein
MDFGKTFEAESRVCEGLVYTFRRLTVAQAAQMRLEVAKASGEHLREVERMKAAGTPEVEIESYCASATIASVVPLALAHTLKSVRFQGGKPINGADWLADPETAEDAVLEAYGIGAQCARLTSQQLGEWLSRGTSSAQAPANATSSDVTTASPSASTNPETAGDTSPRA